MSKLQLKRQKLTPKQERFCIEFLVDFNATQTAIRAGYSPKTARQQGARLLSNVNIRLELAKVTKRVEKKVEINIEKSLRELAFIAFSNVGNLFNEDGKLKDISEMDENDLRAVGGIDIVREKTVSTEKETITEYTTKIRLWDKPKAIEALLKYQIIIQQALLKQSDGDMEFGEGVDSFQELIKRPREQVDNWIQYGNINGPQGKTKMIEDGEFKEVEKK